MDAAKAGREGEKSALDCQLEVLTKQIDEVKSSSSSQIENLEREKLTLEGKISLLDEELNASRLQADELKKRVEGLDETLKVAKEENEADKKLRESLIAEKENLGNFFRKFSLIFLFSNINNCEYIFSVAETEASLKNSETRISELATVHLSEKSLLSDELAKLKQEHEEAINSRANLELKLKTLVDEIECGKEAHKVLVSEKNLLAKELDDLKKDNLEVHSLLEKAQESTGSTSEQVELLQTKLEKANEKIASLEGLQKDGEAKMKNLEEMIEENERRTEAKNSELAEMKSQLEVYEIEMNKAGETIASLESENQELANQNAVLQDENQELQANLMYGDSEQSSMMNTSSNGADKELNVKGTGKVAPRLFCDICDQFDLHETEDCPQQMMQEEESSLHSKHDSKNIVIRAYCDLCEQFGHEEVDCTSKIDEKAPSDEEF